MIYLESDSTDPTFNLALEQYVFDQMDPTHEYLMFWQNDNSIIIGKNQNTLAEINSHYVKEHHIRVVRRLSGGGAVYHDMGNLNFTFIADNNDNSGMDLKKFSARVAKALHRLDIPAEVHGRNDILIQGRKFSGNAQYIKNGRIMHHGTLMFNSDLGVLGEALNVSGSKIESKGIKSIKSRVTNISEHLKKPMTLSDFKQHLTDCLLPGDCSRIYKLTAYDITRIEKLQQEVYATWEWNYGLSPDFRFKKRKRFENCGEIEICMNVENGRISGFAAYGDFFGLRDTNELSALLKGTRLDHTDLQKALQDVSVNHYFNQLETEDFIGLLLS